jgi:hypothetical protein
VSAAHGPSPSFAYTLPLCVTRQGAGLAGKPVANAERVPRLTRVNHAPEHVGTQTLAKLLLLTVRRVRQLREVGVFEYAHNPKTCQELRGRYNLVKSMNADVVFLRDRRTVDPNETSYTVATTRRSSKPPMKNIWRAYRSRHPTRRYPLGLLK